MKPAVQPFILYLIIVFLSNFNKEEQRADSFHIFLIIKSNKYKKLTKVKQERPNHHYTCNRNLWQQEQQGKLKKQLKFWRD